LAVAPGLLGSIVNLLGLDLPVPDHTTFARRSADLGVATALRKARGPVHVLIDSTGLKVFGAGEWMHERHGGTPRRTWRKLHLAVDPDTGEILASALTTTEEGDASLVGHLLDRISGEVCTVTADGAYDGDPVYRAVAERAPNAAVVIPPRVTTVPSDTAETAPTQRDRHLRMIAAIGRMGWQKAVGYGKRSLVEVAMLRYKTLIGRRLHARTLPTQKTEAKVACQVLNIMTDLGMPVSRRVA
jgi:transposase